MILISQVFKDAGSIINIQEGGETFPPGMLQEIVNSEVKGATSLAPLGKNSKNY